MRLVGLLLLIAVGVGAFFLARAVIDDGEGNAQAASSIAIAASR
jgi:hypothetical protein